MKMGTKSVLFGYHCLPLHGWFVLWGWWSLNRFRRVEIGETKIAGIYRRPVYASILSPTLWLAAFIHDIGYWGKPDMDGKEGETHPEVAARYMRAHFGEAWGSLCLYHSRFYAKRDGAVPSALCYADKVAYLKYPTWLIVLLVSATGEVQEYLRNASRDTNGKLICDGQRHNEGALPTVREWAEGVKDFVRDWIAKHADGSPDTTTQVREH